MVHAFLMMLKTNKQKAGIIASDFGVRVNEFVS